MAKMENAPDDNDLFQCFHCEQEIAWLDNWRAEWREGDSLYFKEEDGRKRTVPNSFWHTRDMQRECWKENLPEAKRDIRCLAEPKGMCTENIRVHDYDPPRLCFKRATDEDLNMCGTHAKPIRQDQAEREANRIRREAEEIKKEGLDALVEELRSYGIEASHQSWRNDGNLTVNGAQLLDWMEGVRDLAARGVSL